MANSFKLVLVVVSALVGQGAWAKTIYFGSTIETVPVAYGSPTILRFEEPIKTISNTSEFIIKPVNEETPDYALLAVEPRIMAGKADLSFVLGNGEVARLRLSIVPQGSRVKLETIYDIKSQRSLVESRAEATPYVGRLDLMTAMIRGDRVTGYDISVLKRDVSTPGGSAKITLERLYSGDEFKGYVYEIQNVSAKSTLALDVRKLQFGSPNQAILAYSDRDILDLAGSGQDTTRLVVVAKATAAYREAILPIRVTRRADAAATEDSHE